MIEPAFVPELLERLRGEMEVKIETRATVDAKPHRTTIWLVVDPAGRVLIRSYRGANARWYREATSGTPAALLISPDVVAVSVEHATDAERIQACSRELERKYAGDPATPAMVADDVLGTTLELHPT